MKVMVINSGSSSVKFMVYDPESRTARLRGKVTRIGEPEGEMRWERGGTRSTRMANAASHREAFNLIMDLLREEQGAIGDITEIGAIGHRVVHGGEFNASTVLTEKVLGAIERSVPLAPLHNPPNLMGIREMSRLFPHAVQVAVFDTHFHRGMGETAYLYPIPMRLHQDLRVRRYGFHGTSLRYVSQRASEMLQRPLKDLRMIICHLGNGVTVSAVDGGRSLDTSMGLTPLEGPMMGTRSGDLDPGLIIMLLRSGMDADRLDRMLNEESGLLGISGVSNDVKTLLEKAEENDRCRLALEMYAYRIKKYIGAYLAALSGADALIFTAGTGEKASTVRAMICQGLEALGISLDDHENDKVVGMEGRIDDRTGKVTVLVIPTDEEMVIAKDTLEVVGDGEVGA
jgi:acetate kinase